MPSREGFLCILGTSLHPSNAGDEPKAWGVLSMPPPTYCIPGGHQDPVPQGSAGASAGSGPTGTETPAEALAS